MAMGLNNRLRKIRREKDLTQQALAQAVDVTRQTVIAVEKGRFRPSVELALRMARALDTPLERLFWLDEDEE
jgi:putative transcriptional regulator